MRWAGHVARMREKRNAYRILVGNPEGKRQLGRRRRRWVDNIKMVIIISQKIIIIIVTAVETSNLTQY
jgi:hypothetical protein